MVKKSAERTYGGMAAHTSGSELSENKPRQNFRLGDITWVKHGVSSWWPAQVIDEASVSSKPKKKTSHDALVRLYGTCQYLYVDPWKSNMKFKMILKEENKTTMEAFHKVLQKELTHFKSPSDLDKGQAIDKALSDDSAEGLKDKAHKKASVVRDKKGRKMASLGTPVVGKEGSRRSGRTSAKEYLDATDDSTSQLHDTSASENASEVGDITSVNRSRHKKGSLVDGSHREIKAMVRDILLGDTITRQHAAEMSYVDEMVFGIYDATEGTATPGTTADTEGGGSIKRAGSGLEADPSNAAKRPRKGRVTNHQNRKHNNSKGNDSNSSPSRDVTMEGCEQHSARQIKIMQKLGLVAPSGSPFKGLVAATHR
ncbi:unnamed protein product [Alopecurus aequalis]